MDAAGGGGYEDPFERDLELVEHDVANGYVSIVGAREDYGVVINPETMKVDVEASKKLRKGDAS
jgi:N-methylhydantoinase B